MTERQLREAMAEAVRENAPVQRVNTHGVEAGLKWLALAVLALALA